jgi:hypothetical protein
MIGSSLFRRARRLFPVDVEPEGDIVSEFPPRRHCHMVKFVIPPERKRLPAHPITESFRPFFWNELELRTYNVHLYRLNMLIEGE